MRTLDGSRTPERRWSKRLQNFMTMARLDEMYGLTVFGFMTRQRFRELAFSEQPWEARKAIEQIDLEKAAAS